MHEEGGIKTVNRVMLVSAARTPLGAFCGRLESLPEQQLGAAAMGETVRRAGIDPALIDEVIAGIAKQTSRPSNGGRHAMLLARLPEKIPAYTVQRQSASGLQAVANGYWAIRCGDAEVILAGGMESMSQIPFEIRNARYDFTGKNRQISDAIPDQETGAQPEERYGKLTTVQEDWKRKGIYEILNQLYSEIWVYGNKKFYDPIQEYAIPKRISEKMLFTGYIPRKVPDKKAVRQIRKEQGLAQDEKLVVVTTGGGGDGFAVMDTYLSMLESTLSPLPFKSVLITGPFMADRETKKVIERARRLGVRTYQFCRVMEKMLASADLVVSMGGYNTVCEILSQGTPALIIPREVPRKEQLIRAQVLYNHHLVDYIPWHSFSPINLQERVLAILERPEPYRDAISRFKLTGYEIMRRRLEAFLKKRPAKDRT